MKKAVIVLPTYNERKNISEVIQRVFSISEGLKNWFIYILVVDSNSPDGTANEVEMLQKKYKNLSLLKTEKEGLGKAYIRGFSLALEKINPYVLFEMDSDLSHDPNDIPKFLKKIEEGADFVVGSRYIPGGSIPADWGIHRKVFSILGNWIVRLGFMKLSVTEWTNGYRAMKSWIIKKHLKDMKGYTGYVFQVALLDNAIKSGAKLEEIPVKFTDRVEGSSKINSVEYIYQTIKYVFLNSSFIKFAIVGGIGFIIDFGISYLLIETLMIIIWLSTMISAEAAIISNFILNNQWSFKHKRLSRKESSLLWSFAKFNLIASGSLLIQTVGMTLTTNIFGITYWYIYKVLLIVFIIIPYSYFFYNKLVWKDK